MIHLPFHSIVFTRFILNHEGATIIMFKSTHLLKFSAKDANRELIHCRPPLLSQSFAGNEATRGQVLLSFPNDLAVNEDIQGDSSNDYIKGKIRAYSS